MLVLGAGLVCGACFGSKNYLREGRAGTARGGGKAARYTETRLRLARREKGRGMGSVFFIRYKRVVWTTFFVVFLFCLLITLFTPPTYQSSAVVAFPSGSEPAAEFAVLGRMSKQLTNPPMQNGRQIFPPASRVVVGITLSGKEAVLVVESDRPDAAAEGANALAFGYALRRGSADLVRERAVPEPVPVRPKKAQNMVVGTVFALIFGLFFAFVRSLFGDKKKTVPVETVPPVS